MSTEPDPIDLINQLAEALGHGILPAMPYSPKQVWEALLGEVAHTAAVTENEGLGVSYVRYLPGGSEYGR